MTKKEMLAAAVGYGKRGWAVHPLHPPDAKVKSPGKQAILNGWQTRGIATDDELREWFSNNDYNIGLVCGESSGVIVIDYDHNLFWGNIIKGLGSLTLQSHRTEGRGHAYFKYTPEIKSQKHHLLGIEILSTGSNAVLPPSRHATGDLYTWVNPDIPVVEIPPILLERLTLLFQVEENLVQQMGEVRPCFKKLWNGGSPETLHEANGREAMLAWAAELKARGASINEILMLARLIYKDKFDSRETTKEWNNIKTKPWRCSKIKERLSGVISCTDCPIKKYNKTPQKHQKKSSDTIQNGLRNALGMFKDKIELANEMQKKSPIYYDKSRNYWLWIPDPGYYRRIDETDVMNCIRHNSTENVLNSKERNEILTAIQLTGRELKVKDVPESWVQFKNYVVDYRTGERFKAAPEYFFTSPIPHNIGESADTPIIDRIFNDWMGDEVYKLRELSAYTLSNRYIIHRLFFLFGRGRNGKGQFMEFLERFSGSENTTTVELEKLIESRFEAAKLYTKRIGFVGEANFSILKSTAVLKKLTGDDKIGGEFKHKDPFDFWNSAKLIIAGNSLPTTLDKTDAFYARCIVYEFKNQFPLSKKIVDSIPECEYENFALKCIELLPKLLEQGMFTNEGTISDKAKIYEKISNPISQFIELYYNKDVNGIVALWQFYDKFSIFCDEKGHRKVTKHELKKLIENSYEVEKKNIGGQCWVWIYGISEKETQSDLSVLSNIPYNPHMCGLSGNTDKTDKTDNFMFLQITSLLKEKYDHFSKPDSILDLGRLQKNMELYLLNEVEGSENINIMRFVEDYCAVKGWC